MDFPHLFLVVADALDSGLVIVNAERTVCYINRRAEEILEVRANLASGHGLIALLRDYQVDALASEVLHDHERRETTIQTPLSKRTLRVRCSPLLLDSTLTGALFLIEDVTHISQLERSRRDDVANVRTNCVPRWPRSSCWWKRCNPTHPPRCGGACSDRFRTKWMR
ncbi:MAG: PAS domain-containing protein [Chloroflexaceae bacterium]|nr:PAS domain-containing protein [Chloroflexaceae bacterium]